MSPFSDHGQLSEQEKREMTEARKEIHSTYLKKIGALTDETFYEGNLQCMEDKKDSLDAMERDFLANHFPQDIEHLQRHGLDRHPEEIQTRLVSRMLCLRRGEQPIHLEIGETGHASIQVNYPVRSLTLLNQLFQKLH